MGILREGVKALTRRGGQTAAVAATIPVGTQGVPQAPAHSYERNAREGYMRDELVFACVQMRATSAAEPKLCGYRGDEKVDDHPFLDLWNRPNPFLDRYGLTAGLVMHLDIGGNAYIEKVRSAAGKIMELWLPRPDRMRVIPDARRFVGGYRYELGSRSYDYPPEDIVHLKTRHPLDDFYGLPPLAPLAGRVDLDNWTRDFARAFFQNGAVPIGLLNVMREVDQQEREMIRARLRSEYGGPGGWFNTLLIDGGEAKYEPMGLPLGEQGVAMAALDEINEARICMDYGVPPSLVGARLGLNSSSYANRDKDEEYFWNLTLVPLYTELAADITLGFAEDYPDVDYWAFDFSTVRALQEDQDKLSARVVAQFEKMLITQEEARVKLGYPPKPEKPSVYLVPTNLMPMPSDRDPAEMVLPEPGAEDQEAADGGGDYGGRSNGKAHALPWTRV